MLRLLSIAVLVGACTGAGTSSAPMPTPIAELESDPPAESASRPLTPGSIDPSVIETFRAASARFFESQSQAIAESEGMDADADWPSAQAVLTKQADAYGAFHRDLRSIPWPNPGEDSGGLGSHSTALMAFAQELEAAVRQAAASDSWKEAQESVVEFEGTTYPFLTFLQEATGEFYTALDLTASALGVELPRATPIP